MGTVREAARQRIELLLRLPGPHRVIEVAGGRREPGEVFLKEEISLVRRPAHRLEEAELRLSRG